MQSLKFVLTVLKFVLKEWTLGKTVVSSPESLLFKPHVGLIIFFPTCSPLCILYLTSVFKQQWLSSE